MFLKNFKNFSLLLISFLLLSILTHFQITQKVDEYVLFFFQKITPKDLDLSFSVLSFLGNFEIISMLLLLLLFFVEPHGFTAVAPLDTRFRRAKPRAESHSFTGLHQWLSGAWANWSTKIKAFSIYLFAHIIEIIGKTIIKKPPPPFNLVRTIPLFPKMIEPPGLKFSFPSGHSLRTVFLCSFILYLIKKSKRLSSWQKKILSFIFVFFTIIMLYSRISLAEHWPSDVLGGAILGYLSYKMVFAN